MRFPIIRKIQNTCQKNFSTISIINTWQESKRIYENDQNHPLTLSCITLQNGQTDFKNLAV